MLLSFFADVRVWGWIAPHSYSTGWKARQMCLRNQICFSRSSGDECRLKAPPTLNECQSANSFALATYCFFASQPWHPNQINSQPPFSGFLVFLSLLKTRCACLTRQIVLTIEAWRINADLGRVCLALLTARVGEFGHGNKRTLLAKWDLKSE